MAPLTRRRKKALLAAAPRAPVIDHADRISRLPEEVLAHIVSFLPAQEAVRTCVLARTWRHVWKSTRRLLITAESVKEARQFMDSLLRVRHDGLKDACLDASEIRFNLFDMVEMEDEDDYYFDEYASLDSEAMSSVSRWIRRLLKCQIKMLRIDIDFCGRCDGYLEMSNRPLLVSRHLIRLELKGVWFCCRCLNLDGCPALEHLEINECMLLSVRKIMSLSLKSLIIISCDSNYVDKRIQICVPCLVSLRLDNTQSPFSEGVRTPLLERMPELVGAEVWIDSIMDECDCDNPMACYHVTRDGDTSDIDSDSDGDDHEQGSGDYAGQNTTKCVVLEGLAQARDLVLIGRHPTYILRRDLRWCPTFTNLKTLVLIEKYKHEPADCSVLECMLEHAPLLEKFTLILEKEHPGEHPGGTHNVEIKGYPDAKVTSTKISQHLQIIKIICKGVHGISVNVLNLLDTLNICFKTKVTKYKP